jgi:hypothetical protein
MATTVSIADQGNGNYVITDSDGQTRIVGKPIATQESAKVKIPITPIGGKTSANTTGFNNPAGASFPGSGASGTAEATVMMNGKSIPVTEAIRQAYSSKNLGIIRKNLLDSKQLTTAEARDPNNLLNKWSQIVYGASNDPDPANKDPFVYAKSLQDQGFVSTAGSTGNYPPTAYISSPSDASNTIQSVFNQTLKRNATDKEIASWTQKLNKAEKASPSKYETVNGVLQYTKPLNGSQWIADQLMKLPEFATSVAAKSQEGIAALQATAQANGLDLNSNFASQLPEWEKAIANGADVKTYQTMIRNAARNHLPDSIKNNIDPTTDLNVFYSPYINSYAKTFGMDPTQVKISDIEPLVLTDKGTLNPIYQFDKNKRTLPNWQYTPEAKTAVADSVQQVLKDFGFMG